MKNIQNKKILQIVLIVVVAIITLGIGYATISAINLIINGNATATVNDSNFIVHFTDKAESITGTTGAGGDLAIDTNDDTIAYFNVTGLTKSGDYGVASYTVANDSNAIGADITLKVTNSNSEYFKVTETIDDTQLQAGDTTTATVKVEMIKTPINDTVTTTVTAKLIANPLENESATGIDPASKASDDPESFATDSWATIKKAVHNNNTSLYHVGDTKTVTINGTDYTVRIANKSTSSNCGNTNYSETACGFVVEFSDIITKMQMGDYNTSAGGYPATKVFDYLNNTLLGQLPSDLQSIIEPTRVISGHADRADSANFVSENQKLYLLSGVEVYGYDSNDTSMSEQLEYYQNNSGTKQFNSSNEWWWLRTPCSSVRGTFRFVYATGGLGLQLAGHVGGVSPAFRIA